ncbi:MAG: UDP-glucose/GDP-mannose dehydrogenase family protein [Ignavibacteriales bacterium]|nr:UDP-glucose/GDP-mannose dehydrogenase family protein [Ignavibacteriales bacterium]
MNISVIGTGYVGLVTGTCFAEMGNNVICVDNDIAKLEKLNNNEVPIFEPGLESIFLRNIKKQKLQFTNNLEDAVLSTEIIFLCLPTPQDEDGSADLKYVFGITEDIGNILQKTSDKDFKIIVNKSTVPVGTTQKIADILKKYNLNNFQVASNPEFLREGYAVEDFLKPDRVVIGTNDDFTFEKLKELYKPFVMQGNPVIRMDPFSSEVTKYAANSYLATRITFMNELANFCEIVGANIDLVRIGMGADTRIGKRFLFAGIGYGGSCFPKDVKALIKTSIEHKSDLNLLKVVDKVNDEQKHILTKKVLKYFNNDLTEKEFAVWGLAFKPNTDDMREAPSVIIINDLLKLGAKIRAYDPAALDTAKFYLSDSIKYSEDQYLILNNADALLIFTEWNEFRNPDFDIIKSSLNQPVIFDGRNVYEPMKMKELGFTYFSIGRQPVQ